MKKELDINFILQLALEGIHRGVGMDRAMFSLLDQKGKLVGKHAVQDKQTSLTDDFSFTMDATPLFQDVIKKKQSVWSHKAVRGPMASELLAKFQVMLGTNDFLAGPLMVQGKPIGLYYADRQITKQKLTLSDYRAFMALVDRANAILNNFGL